VIGTTTAVRAVIGAANIRRPITNSMVLTVLSRIGGCPATIRRQSSQLQMRPATKSAAWLTMPLSIKAVALTFVVDAVPVIRFGSASWWGRRRRDRGRRHGRRGLGWGRAGGR